MMCKIIRCLTLAALFVKEQLKEPIAIFWMIISPAAIFYLLSYSGGGFVNAEGSYLKSTAWFYAHISSNVAFFGFSFYIIGRRESGFIRSFVYASDAKFAFMLAQFFACSLISLMYCAVFYALTCFQFGGFKLFELLMVLPRFYISYIFFCVPGILLSLMPMSFQNSSTLFSMISFAMLVFSVLGMRNASHGLGVVDFLNPLYFASGLMESGFHYNYGFVLLALLLFVAVFLLALKFLRVNPVWSRY
jgi:ABC-2 type transport system permease protein